MRRTLETYPYQSFAALQAVMDEVRLSTAPSSEVDAKIHALFVAPSSGDHLHPEIAKLPLTRVQADVTPNPRVSDNNLLVISASSPIRTISFTGEYCLA